MDLSSMISIVVGILSIGTQVFIVGNMWGKMQQKDKEREGQICRIENDHKEKIKDMNNWINKHEDYHKDRDEKLNDKISTIDKNVAVLIEKFVNISEKWKP